MPKLTERLPLKLGLILKLQNSPRHFTSCPWILQWMQKVRNLDTIFDSCRLCVTVVSNFSSLLDMQNRLVMQHGFSCVSFWNVVQLGQLISEKKWGEIYKFGTRSRKWRANRQCN